MHWSKTIENDYDLLRKKASEKKLIILDPEIENPTKEVCRLMRKTEAALNITEKPDFDAALVCFFESACRRINY